MEKCAACWEIGEQYQGLWITGIMKEAAHLNLPDDLPTNLVSFTTSKLYQRSYEHGQSEKEQTFQDLAQFNIHVPVPENMQGNQTLCRHKAVGTHRIRSQG